MLRSEIISSIEIINSSWLDPSAQFLVTLPHFFLVVIVVEGIASWIGPLSWWQASLWHGALFALAFGLFTLIARIERFGIAFVATVLLILLFRLVVVNA